MATLEDLEAQPRTHRVMLFGAPGTGKTWSIGKLAETHKLWYFSLENGHRTLLNPECVAPKYRKNVTIIPMQDSPETPIVCSSLDTFFKKGHGEFCEQHGRNSCALCAKLPSYTPTKLEIPKLTDRDILIFDSLTQWEASISFYLTRETDGEVQRSGDKVFDYYRKLALYLNRSLSRIQLISNTSIIVISHETDTSNVEGKEKIVPAGGSRNFARNNARYFDSVFYFYKENKKHKVASKSTYSTKIDTKDRSSFDAGTYTDTAEAVFKLFNPESANSN